MNTTPITYPLPEPLKAYFKQEFFYLLKSYAAHDVMFHASCHQLSKEVDAIGWSLDRHLVWFMSHFNVKPEDYEFSYIDSLIVCPHWQDRYEDYWEEWLDKLIAPSKADLDGILDAEEIEDE